MIYKEVCGDRVSGLAFGTMRLPQKDGAIDQEQVNRMTDYAIEKRRKGFAREDLYNQ